MKKILLTISFILSSAIIVSATPPQELNLTYNAEKKVLKVEIAHTSNKLNKHYIRKIVIAQGTKTPDEHFFNRQSAPYRFVEEFPLEAKTGDAIRVTVYCSEGGTKEAELVIPEASEEKKGEEKKEIPAPTIREEGYKKENKDSSMKSQYP